MKTKILATALAAFSLCANANAQSPTDQSQREPTNSAIDTGIAFHIAGYADLAYSGSQASDDSYLFGTLAPILHAQIGDSVFLEAELELEANSLGERETGIEYANVNVLIGDNAALVVGKFLSPVGYYFQNLHPSWINRTASAPVGFGHGGAAPLSEVGIQLRGGKIFSGGQHLNYALYGGNGPDLMIEDEDAPDLDTGGDTDNEDGERSFGGRVGWMPVAKVELGLSAARGDVALLDAAMSTDEPSRSYRVDGFDVAWKPTPSLDLRAEWIRQRIGSAAGSALPEQATWRAWYAQAAYRFESGKWEAVFRYGDAKTPHGESTLSQTAIGLNYLFQPRSTLKLTLEFNDSIDEEAGRDRFILQYAYAL
ncbi:MAG: porin [Pseudomonadota bacterium]